MSDPIINGKVQTAFDVGQFGNGNKTEFNAAIALIPELTLNLHSEFKSGLGEQDVFSDTEVKPQDLLVRGIYGEKMGMAIFKAINLVYKPIPTLSLGFGFKDLGRDVTSNGAKSIGASDISDLSRNPTMPFFERPPVHVYPGSTIGFFIDYTDKIPVLALHFFAGASSGKSSQGMIGLQKRAFNDNPKTPEDDTQILPIFVVDDDDFTNGGFFTFGGDLGIKLSADILAFIGANLSVRTFEDVDAKKTYDKKSSNEDAIYNPSVALGLELFKRVTIWGDMSWVLDPASDNKGALGWRVGARGHVLTKPWGDLALQLGAMGISAGQGAQIFNDELVYLDDEVKETQIIGPEGPVTVKVPTGGGDRSGTAVAGGLVVNWKAFTGGVFTFSLAGGGVQDDKLGDSYQSFIDFRTAFSYGF